MLLAIRVAYCTTDNYNCVRTFLFFTNIIYIPVDKIYLNELELQVELGNGMNSDHLECAPLSWRK